MYAKSKSSESLRYGLKRNLVELDATVNGGNPIPGQDYILRIQFNNYVGISDADQYWKYAQVRAYQGMTASDLYARLAISLAKNMSREVAKLIDVYVTDGTTPVLVTPTTTIDELTGTYTGIIVEEVEQKWILGTMPVTHVNYVVTPTTVLFGGDNLVWGTVTPQDPVNFVNNGKEIADREYFFAGYKGDIYRNVGFPDVIHTTYLVNAADEYSTVDLHFYYVGPNEAVQKSEKDIQLYIPSTGSDYTVANQIIAAINTAIADTDIVLETLA
jgi:hypothetical protein